MISFEEAFRDVPRTSYWDTKFDGAENIVLYGTGNGADKIIDACEKYGIGIKGVFASAGFVRDRVFRGMKVLSFDDVVNKFGQNLTILVCFGSTREEVLSYISGLDEKYDVRFPEVPLYGGGIFDGETFSRIMPDLEKVFESLSDDESRLLFRDAVEFRMTGRMKCLSRTEEVRETLIKLFSDVPVRTAVDGGAFRGDSAEDMLFSLPGIEKIVACEPDPSTYKKLSEFAAADRRVIPVGCALGERSGTAKYVSSGSRGSGIDGKNRRAREKEITVSTVDELVDGCADYIKLDVEGSEKEAILGAERTIKYSRPALSVSLYHRTLDFVELPLLAARLLPYSRTYLRRPRCVPMWDLTLYVIPEEKTVKKQ